MRSTAMILAALVCGGLALLRPCAAAPCMPEFTGLPEFELSRNYGTSALADIDRDGKLDLLTGTAYHLGAGDGSFGSPIFLRGEPGGVFDVVVRDFDGDGRLDLALGPKGGLTITVYFGKAPGPDSYIFADPLFLVSIESPWHVVAADLDEDGREDLVGVSTAEHALAIHRNRGDRTFEDMTRAPSTVNGHAVAAGDYDGDGHVDIAVGSGEQAAVMFGDGSGKLRSTRSVILAPPGGPPLVIHRFRAADFDGDGRSDLVGIGVVGGGQDDGALIGYWGSHIDPDSGLPSRGSFGLDLPSGGRFLEICDANADGFLDIVAQGVASSSFIQVYYGGPGDPYGFTPAPEFMTGLSGHGSVLAVADVDNDHSVDLILTTEDTMRGRVFLNDGSCGSGVAAFGDPNFDGRRDVADAIAILSHLFAHKALPCRPAANTNGDDAINIADAVYLLQHLFAKGPPPPAGTVPCAGAARA